MIQAENQKNTDKKEHYQEEPEEEKKVKNIINKQGTTDIE